MPPAKKKSPKPVTTAAQWKKGAEGEDLEMPSGNVARVKRVPMDKLLAMNMIPDSLTPIAQKAVDAGRAGVKHEVDMSSVGMEDMSAIFDAIDRITVLAVVEPKVVWHKRQVVTGQGEILKDGEDQPLWEDIPAHERDEDVLYSDDVDFEDKSFIFNFVVGGTRDLESFRKEFSTAVAGVQPGEDVEL